MMYKALITEPMPLFEEERKRYYDGILEVTIAERIDEDYLVKAIDDFDVLMVVYAKVTKRIIDAGKKLKVIARYGIGTDNIDVDYATTRSIPVVYSPEYHIPSVPEHILALMFALARRVTKADYSVKSGNWDYREFAGVDIEGKTLGIIGFGRIGRALAKKAFALGMKVICYDPYIADVDAHISKHVQFDSFDNVVSNADFLSICAPLTSLTKGLINRDVFAKMKPSSYLINTARGAIVSESDLYEALSNNTIAGAAIDVMEQEPPAVDNKLFNLQNIIITPHIAWFTEEATQRLEFTVAKGIIDVLNDKTPEYVANPEVFKNHFNTKERK